MRGIPVVSAVDEEYLLKLKGNCYLSFPDDASSIDMNEILDFYDEVYKDRDIEAVHSKIRSLAIDNVSVETVMKPVIELLKSKDFVYENHS